MLRIVCSLFLVLVVAPPTHAQEHRFEVFAGFSHLESGGEKGGSLRPPLAPFESSQRGWVGSAAWSVTDHIAVEGEVTGHYGGRNGRTTIGFSDTPEGGLLERTLLSEYDTHTFMGGVRLFGSLGRVRPFARGLVGAARQTDDQELRFRAVVPGCQHAECGPSIAPVASVARRTDFAFSAGGGLDVEITDRLAWRLVQADYLRTSFGDASQDNVKLATGLVVRF
jgi:hypothetical protein